MKVKLAESISVSVCDNCSAVHIEMWRDGRIFAEALPVDPEAFAQDLTEAIAIVNGRKRSATAEARKH